MAATDTIEEIITKSAGPNKVHTAIASNRERIGDLLPGNITQSVMGVLDVSMSLTRK